VSAVFISLSFLVPSVLQGRFRKEFKGERGLTVDRKQFGNEAFRKR